MNQQGHEVQGNHTNQGHEVQGMQVTTPTRTRTTRRHKPARHKVQGVQVTTSNNHTNHKARADTNQQARGSRYAGNHFQQAPTTRTHQPARHKVQGMQVTTSNQHQPQGHTKTHEPAGTRFKVCR